jgi:YHS domain-containing protein
MHLSRQHGLVDLCVLKPSHMKLFLLSFLLILLNAPARSQTTYFVADGAAIRGYDPVAYFISGKAVKGSPEFSHTWSQATWLFSSRENLEAFRARPEKYAPQFGGFCAYGASEQHKAPTDPQAWTIKDDKLYLNYSLKVKDLWLPDTVVRIPAAEKYWKSIQQ